MQRLAFKQGGLNHIKGGSAPKFLSAGRSSSKQLQHKGIFTVCFPVRMGLPDAAPVGVRPLLQLPRGRPQQCMQAGVFSSWAPSFVGRPTWKKKKWVGRSFKKSFFSAFFSQGSEGMQDMDS